MYNNKQYTSSSKSLTDKILKELKYQIYFQMTVQKQHVGDKQTKKINFSK